MLLISIFSLLLYSICSHPSVPDGGQLVMFLAEQFVRAQGT